MEDTVPVGHRLEVGIYYQYNEKVCNVIYRMAEFTFLVDKNREVPTITFTGEDPYLQYVSINSICDYITIIYINRISLSLVSVLVSLTVSLECLTLSRLLSTKVTLNQAQQMTFNIDL